MNREVFAFATKSEVNRAYDVISRSSDSDSNGPFFELNEQDQTITVVWHEAVQTETIARDSIVRLIEEFGARYRETGYRKVA